MLAPERTLLDVAAVDHETVMDWLRRVKNHFRSVGSVSSPSKIANAHENYRRTRCRTSSSAGPTRE